MRNDALKAASYKMPTQLKGSWKCETIC